MGIGGGLTNLGVCGVIGLSIWITGSLWPFFGLLIVIIIADTDR